MPILPKTLGEIFQINTSVDDDQVNSKITSLPDGYVVTWTTESASGGTIHAQLFALDGTAIGDALLITEIDTSDSFFAGPSAVTALPDGGFLVAYSRYDPDGLGSGIFGKRFDSDGNVIQTGFGVSEFTINADGGGSPSIEFLSNGNYVVVWVGAGIGGQLFSPDGTPIGEEFSISQTNDRLNFSPEMSPLENGGFVVTWTSRPDSVLDIEIMARIYDANGVPLGPEFQVNSSLNATHHFSEITTLADGSFVITWEAVNLEDTPGGTLLGPIWLAAQRFDANGTPIGDEILVGDRIRPEGTGFSPNITAMPDGGFIIIWTDVLTEIKAIQGQRYDANSQKIGNVFTITDELDGYPNGGYLRANPDIQVLADGSYIVTWNSGTAAEPGYEVFALHFTAQYYGTSGDDTLSDTVGANWMRGMQGDDTLFGLDGNDKLFGNRGDDTLYGGEGNDKLIGGAGNDTLVGGTGNDRLIGGAGNDTLIGGTGNDRLIGGGGADTLIGGAGKDIMKGGAGADVFVFNDISDSNSGEIDRIKGFQTGIDTVDLADIVAGELTFIAGADFTGTGTAELRYFTNARDNTFLLADIEGDGTIDFKVFFKGAIDFTADDFIL